MGIFNGKKKEEPEAQKPPTRGEQIGQAVREACAKLFSHPEARRHFVAVTEHGGFDKSVVMLLSQLAKDLQLSVEEFRAYALGALDSGDRQIVWRFYMRWADTERKGLWMPMLVNHPSEDERAYYNEQLALVEQELLNRFLALGGTTVERIHAELDAVMKKRTAWESREGRRAAGYLAAVASDKNAVEVATATIAGVQAKKGQGQ